MLKVPAKEIKNRIFNLKKAMEKENIDLAIITENVDRYYFSGTMQNGLLLIHRDYEPVLFVIRSLKTAIEESALNYIVQYKGTKDILNFIIKNKLKVKRLGLEMDVLPAVLYEKFGALFADTEIFDISPIIKTIRMIKSDFEINLIREAAKRLDNILNEMKLLIKPGIEEYDLLPDYMRLIAKYESSPCIRTRQYNMEAIQKYILSGSSVARLSYMDSPSAGGYGVSIAFPGGAGHKKIKENEPILIDLVINYEGYNVDCTRIFAIGKLEERFIKAHDIAKRCHDLFVKMAESGESVGNIYKEVFNIVEKSPYLKYFMGGVKFIGHGIGLELDEIPVITKKSDKRIMPGMVIAFEPKFIFEDGAAGYETTYLIKEKGNVEALNRINDDIMYI